MTVASTTDVFLTQVSAMLATHVFAWIDGDHAAVIRWLKTMGCTVTPMGEDWVVHGKTGMTIGLTNIDPVSTAVQLGMCLAGMWWPFAFPELLNQVNKEWRRRTKAAKAAKRQHKETP